MNPRLQRQEKKLGPTFIVSLLCHLVVILVCARLNILGAITLSSAPVYYVDVVNLPVAHPQAAESAGGAAAPELTPAPPPSTPPAMKLPAKAAEQAKKPQAKAPAAPATAAPGSKRETSREFEERLARLERNADTRRQAAAIEALRKKVASGAAGTGGPAGRAGAPGASGTQ
ncbi:MAG TPA: energy transducer TonB, partial [Geobacteraceae bacterium]